MQNLDGKKIDQCSAVSSRIFIVITFAATTVGQSTAMMPQYSKAKTAAIHIFGLMKRRSAIDPTNDINEGVILVC